MEWANVGNLQAARDRAYSMPIEDIVAGDSRLFEDDTLWPYFERLRSEDPVHCNIDEDNSRYWSVTKYDDIISIDNNHELFSPLTRTTPSSDPVVHFKRAALISNSPPRHTLQRKAVSPVFSARNLANLESTIRHKVVELLNSIPIEEDFNCVEILSSELTNIMFTTLFGIPSEHRHKLARWHDVASNPDRDIGMPEESEEQRRSELLVCADYFFDLWDRRASEAASNDLISMLAHGLNTANMDRADYMGHLIGLILGGTHTMRSAITGSVLALNQNPLEYEKLRKNPGLISNMISETMRWQTPLGFIHRQATRDCELRGKSIKAGELVQMWYVSGNRDEEFIDEPNQYSIERKRPRQHLSYGFGIHRCLGNRLAEMQMRIAWEEILARFQRIEVVGTPVRFRSCFVRDFSDLPVRVSVG